eukprot:430781-Hanusia_phi.AAC.1
MAACQNLKALPSDSRRSSHDGMPPFKRFTVWQQTWQGRPGSPTESVHVRVPPSRVTSTVIG